MPFQYILHSIKKIVHSKCEAAVSDNRAIRPNNVNISTNAKKCPYVNVCKLISPLTKLK